MKLYLKQPGFILITVLILINIIGILITLSLAISELEQQMSFNHLLFYHDAQVSQVALLTAYTNLKQQSVPCEIEPLSINNFLQKSINWWHSSATCKGSWNKENFQYVFELLQIDPCATLAGKNAVQYWRITARTENKFHNTTQSLVQTTVVVPVETLLKCPNAIQTLNSAWQSWRKLK